MKWVLRIVAVVVVLVVLALVGVWFYIDSIAESAIERGGTYAMGVDTSVDGVDVGVFGGEMSLSGLTVANPQGFSAPFFLQLGDGDVAVTLGSLMEDTVDVPRLHLSDLTVNLQQGDEGANYQVILDNLKKLSGDQPQEPGQTAKGYRIQQIVIENVTVNADVMGQTIRDIRIPKIQMENVGTDSDTGVLLSQVQGEILRAVLEAIARNPQAIPGLLASGLNSGLAEVGNIAGATVDVIGNVTGEVGKVLETVPGGKQAQDVLEQTGGKAREAIEGVGGQLQGILGGKKQQEEPAEPQR